MTVKKTFIPEPLPRFKACFACKARKVRCDGVHPICGTCAKREKGDRELVSCEWTEDNHHSSPSSCTSASSSHNCRSKRKRSTGAITTRSHVKKESPESEDHDHDMSDRHSNASFDHDFLSSIASPPSTTTTTTTTTTSSTSNTASASTTVTNIVKSEPYLTFSDNSLQNEALPTLVNNYDGFSFQFPMNNVSESPTGVPSSWTTTDISGVNERMERMEYRMVNLENMLATQNKTITILTNTLQALQHESRLLAQSSPSSDDIASCSSSTSSLLSLSLSQQQQNGYPFVSTSMSSLSSIPNAPMLSSSTSHLPHISPTSSCNQFPIVPLLNSLDSTNNSIEHNPSSALGYDLSGFMSVGNNNSDFADLTHRFVP